MNNQRIQISEIHLALECLITLKVPHDYKTNLDKKASGILAKWRPLLERSLSNVHWVFEDAASLKNMVYIPTYHGAIALTFYLLIYGLMDFYRYTSLCSCIGNDLRNNPS